MSKHFVRILQKLATLVSGCLPIRGRLGWGVGFSSSVVDSHHQQNQFYGIKWFFLGGCSRVSRERGAFQFFRGPSCRFTKVLPSPGLKLPECCGLFREGVRGGRG